MVLHWKATACCEFVDHCLASQPLVADGLLRLQTAVSAETWCRVRAVGNRQSVPFPFRSPEAPTESGCHLNQSKVLLSTDYLEDGSLAAANCY